VKKWHPDVCHAPEAEAKFKEIQKSFTVLDDQRARNDYDLELLSIEATGMPRDSTDIILEHASAVQYQPQRKSKQKKPKKQKLKREAHVFLDEVPDGFGDTSLDEVIPET
jgi:curved DNA-binding protein CbpA